MTTMRRETSILRSVRTDVMAGEDYFVFYTLLMCVSRASKTQSSSSLKVPASVIAHLFNIFN